MSRTRSLRASGDKWELWALAAERAGKSLNGWMTDACMLVAERDLAEWRRAADERERREGERAVMAGRLWE